MKATWFFSTLVCAFAGAANASTITFTFQEHGHNLDLGPTTTFSDGGYTLTASGFTKTGSPTDLYAKFTSGNKDETGLGTAHGGDHEINTTEFIQLTLPTTPSAFLKSIGLGSVQAGETARVYFTTTPGSLTGATLLGMLNGKDGSISIPSADRHGYIDITASSGNVLLKSAVIQTIPDGGATAGLVGLTIAALALAHRRVIS
jgi:hypothetical protein